MSDDCPQAIKDAAVGVANAGLSSDTTSSPNPSLTPMPFTLSTTEATAWLGRDNGQIWWVRSVNGNFFISNGNVTSTPMYPYGVRPAFWVELNLTREQAAVPVNPMQITANGYTFVKSTTVDNVDYALITKTTNYGSDVAYGYIADTLVTFLASTDGSYPEDIRKAAVGVNNGLWGDTGATTPRPDALAEVFIISTAEANVWAGRSNGTFWWLRSGTTRNYVNAAGLVAGTPMYPYGVRPAFWVAYTP